MSTTKKLIFYHLLSFVVVMFLVLPLFAVAQKSPPDPAPASQNNKIVLVNPFKVSTLDGLVTLILKDIVMPIGYVIAALMIIYSGFMFVTAQGSPDKIKTAKNALLYAVIGAIILLGAEVITRALQGTVDQLRKP